jgi:ubiquinone/menaquinone biosynthesis C-methylase UbiE
VACGTGRTLSQLARAHPKLRFTGLDLSPYYVQHARQLLAEVEDLSLIADNAEAMPFADQTFDVLTCVHLFPELPRPARHNVYREMLRVLKPGGVLVIEDSLQNTDSSTMSFFLQQFSKDFHEPFHDDYAKDDIGQALKDHGFEKVETELHFVAKVVRANKPA